MDKNKESNDFFTILPNGKIKAKLPKDFYDSLKEISIKYNTPIEKVFEDILTEFSKKHDKILRRKK